MYVKYSSHPQEMICLTIGTKKNIGAMLARKNRIVMIMDVVLLLKNFGFSLTIATPFLVRNKVEYRLTSTRAKIINITHFLRNIPKMTAANRERIKSIIRAMDKLSAHITVA